MKQINLFHKYSNPRIKILIKEKSNNKFQFISVLNGKKKILLVYIIQILLTKIILILTKKII